MSYYRTKILGRALAYRRVSTTMQGQSGVGLEGQRVAIEEFARCERIEILDWFEDVASGYGKLSLERRMGLQTAIASAKEHRIPILVFDGSRISRNAHDLLSLVGEKQVEIISVSEGALVDSTLASSAARSQHERERISEATKKKLQELRAEGVKLGNPTNLAEAQKKGAAANHERAERVAQQIADVLKDVSDHEGRTAREIVEILNQRGIRTGSGRPWTVAALRRPLARAKEILEQRRKEHYARNPNFGRF